MGSLRKAMGLSDMIRLANMQRIDSEDLGLCSCEGVLMADLKNYAKSFQVPRMQMQPPARARSRTTQSSYRGVDNWEACPAQALVQQGVSALWGLSLSRLRGSSYGMTGIGGCC